MERILNYLDLPPQERDAVCKQLRSLGCSPAHGTRRTMKKEMEKSRPGPLPQYLFLFRDHTLIGYLFLIAEKEGFCRAFPWWAVHNADELPRNTALSFLAHGIQLSLDCGCPTLANRLQAQLEDQKKGIGRRPEEACR